MNTYAGVDAGGTLIKIAYLEQNLQNEDADQNPDQERSEGDKSGVQKSGNDRLDLSKASSETEDTQRKPGKEQGNEASSPVPVLLKFQTSHIEEAAAWLTENLPVGTQIGFTGGQASLLRGLLPAREHDVDVPEFEATAEGAVRILRDESAERSIEEISAERFVLVNVGTGTSLYLIDGAERPRLGGIGLGGGTIVGLTGMLCGVRDYAEIARLAPLGDREAVDLTVGQIYAPAQPPIAGDLTAANFARPLPPEGGAQPQDYAAAVIGMVAEIVTTVGVQAAKLHGASTVVYVGSSYENNALLHELTVRFTAMLGCEAVIPDRGSYSGAVGALYAAMSV